VAIPDSSDEDLAERLQEFVYDTITALVVLGALDAKSLGSARSATLVVIGTAVHRRSVLVVAAELRPMSFELARGQSRVWQS